MNQSPAPSSSRSNLQRGAACFYCRRRKMKCDGARPICGPCERGNRPDDCEYTNGQKRARAEILQENITQLERRIAELENPPALPPGSGIALHQPYQAHLAQQTQSWATADEPPMDLVEKLIDTFLAYASEFGFFLNNSRFRQAAIIRQPIGHPARPAPPLLSVVYLWGLRLSKQPALIAQEPVFLARALKLAANGLAGSHPHKVIHTLQAEVLLAYYFFAAGRFLEGKYHVAAAVSLSLSSGLHQVRSSSSAPGAASTSANVLPPLQDAVEEGERIRACWTIVILDNAWAVALTENPNLERSQCVVDTPWPLEMEGYESGRLSPTARFNNTINKFLNDAPTSDAGKSTLALLAKATLLWQRADTLMRGSLPSTPPLQANPASAMLDGLIARFRANLPLPTRLSNSSPAMVRTLAAAHSIAHAAALQLHPHPAGDRDRSGRIAAARAVLDIVAAAPLPSGACVNPIMGTVWRTTSQALMDEVRTLRAAHRHPKEEAALVNLLARASEVLAPLTGMCPLLNYQISRIQEEFNDMQNSF